MCGWVRNKCLYCTQPLSGTRVDEQVSTIPASRMGTDVGLAVGVGVGIMVSMLSHLVEQPYP
jgi:hypothetical protein